MEECKRASIIQTNIREHSTTVLFDAIASFSRPQICSLFIVYSSEKKTLHTEKQNARCIINPYTLAAVLFQQQQPKAVPRHHHLHAPPTCDIGHSASIFSPSSRKIMMVIAFSMVNKSMTTSIASR